MGIIAKKAQLASVNPTNWHYLQAYLAARKDQPILRIYTQNIDGIEDLFITTKARNAEMKATTPDLVVYLHGNLRWARCRTCKTYETLQPDYYKENDNPQCQHCHRQRRNNERLKSMKALVQIERSGMGLEVFC
jgi:NAD-dependent SIR2 family protein deacetylase